MATNYIDRNALIEHIRKDPLFDFVEQYGITGVIESFPTADVQPVKHGRWEESFERIVDLTYKVKRCSICGKTKPMKIFEHEDCLFNYCPNCGARMDGET